MVLIIDNYDSFVYNLARYIRELGFDICVKRNDAITIDEIFKLKPSHILISPGPYDPTKAGISLEVIRQLGPTTPILGVCLGHQAIAYAYGAAINRSPQAIHGKASLIQHDGTKIFAGLPNPLKVGRYHSLTVDKTDFPVELQINAYADDENAEIMAIQHREYPVFGVQFHPESVLTDHGYSLLNNFLLLSP